MADAVTTSVILAGGKHYIATFTNISDGTGESAVAKVDISTLTKSNGEVPTKTRIKEIFWNIQGFTSVRLLWDHTTDDLIAPLSGSGYLDLHDIGGKIDPASAGGTGDILLTTNGGVSGSTYLIVLVVELI